MSLIFIFFVSFCIFHLFFFLLYKFKSAKLDSCKNCHELLSMKLNSCTKCALLAIHETKFPRKFLPLSLCSVFTGNARIFFSSDKTHI